MSKKVASGEYDIDEDIKDLVEFCNNNGIKTLASCSGTLKDHKEAHGFGQLNIKDSETSRKIAAVIIEKEICRTDLHSKPAEEMNLYGNIVSYSRINFSFKNPNNEILPKVEEIVHQVVSRQIEPNEEIMEKVNQIFEFFDSIDRKVNSSYVVNASDFSGELTFNTDNISSRKRVDKAIVAENLSNATGSRIVDESPCIGIAIEDTENLNEILDKAKEAVKKAPNISKRKEIKKNNAREKIAMDKASNYVNNESLTIMQNLLDTQTNTVEESVIAYAREENGDTARITDDIILETRDER